MKGPRIGLSAGTIGVVRARAGGKGRAEDAGMIGGHARIGRADVRKANEAGAMISAVATGEDRDGPTRGRAAKRRRPYRKLTCRWSPMKRE
jgi:hypothetical protein